MKVNLTYFKPSGKYYSTGSYLTSKCHMFEIWEEVQIMADTGELPNLSPGWSTFTILVSVPTHPSDHPQLITARRPLDTAPQEQSSILRPGHHHFTVLGSGAKGDPKRFHCIKCRKEFGLLLNNSLQECVSSD